MLLIIVQTESIYCEYSSPYSSLIVIFVLLIKVRDLLVFIDIYLCI